MPAKIFRLALLGKDINQVCLFNGKMFLKIATYKVDDRLAFMVSS